jgi:hypothetical protein
VYRGTLRGGVAETPIAVLSAGSSPYVLIEDKTMYRAELVGRQAVIKDEGAS